MVAERKKWKVRLAGIDPDRLVFLDETWVREGMMRLRGRAPRGRRLIDKMPFKHWKTTTYLAGLRLSGIVAPVVLEGAINGEMFAEYVRKMLVPTLRRGDIVVMDNLSSHKVAGIREMIRAAGAEVLYIPPYSPELNPIENVLAKMKAHLRRLRPRTRRRLRRELGRFPDSLARSEIAACFRHGGDATPERTPL